MMPTTVGGRGEERLAVRVLGHRMCPENKQRSRIKEQRGKNTLKTFMAEIQLRLEPGVLCGK